MFRNLLQRAALAAAVSLAVTGLSLASDGDEGILVRILDEGVAETVHIGDLAVGETRQLAAESGKPVIATRTEDGLELDIDGELTVLRLTPHGPLDDPELLALVEAAASGAGDGEVRRIVRVHAGAHPHAVEVGTDGLHADGHAAGSDGHQRHRVVVVRRGDGGADVEVGADGTRVLMLDDDAAHHAIRVDGGKTVIVERRRARSDDDASE